MQVKKKLKKKHKQLFMYTKKNHQNGIILSKFVSVLKLPFHLLVFVH